MPRNNSKARRQWRKARADLAVSDGTERLLIAIFGGYKGADNMRPGGSIGWHDDPANWSTFGDLPDDHGTNGF